MRVTTEPVQVRETATVDLPRSADAVFSFMWDPASSLELFDAVEVAATLPGRTGVGEFQAFVERTPAGRFGVLHEVVEFDPGRRAVIRSVVGVCPTWGALTVEPIGTESCRLTQEFWADIPAGVPVGTDTHLRDGFQQRLRALAVGLSEWAARRSDWGWPA
ncbi:SRPBCC family protein [Asanoa sp. WMMD1127]|uniref:SRPBCC family protein n=1 Tax=Asanoa sp. WMMD1127 TaxID=3016107 RepID=UPI0024165652|nr:SRPBCC family protein [Asanoa sp. WMMD1127]MDG4821691.1 SRPBCC family protein [Asanoa sp. WMMD1127]